MAKKKTENIKAAPVLRSGGESKTKTYQIMDPWKDMDKVNLVDVKSVDGEITDVKVNGEPAGGGGGGDFSTAEVTVIVEGDGDYNSITAPLIDGNQATGFGEPRDERTVFTVILYKGTAIAEIDVVGGETPLTVSGNITINDRVLTITGDGTVTVG
jgi:hypothetical protein